MALLAAKAKAINRLKSMDPDVDESQIVGRLLAYSSGIKIVFLVQYNFNSG